MCKDVGVVSTPTRHTKAHLRAKLGIREQLCVISAGRFVQSEGFDLLIQSEPQFGSDVDVYIIGGEPTDLYVELKDQLHAANVAFRRIQRTERICATIT